MKELQEFHEVRANGFRIHNGSIFDAISTIGCGMIEGRLFGQDYVALGEVYFSREDQEEIKGENTEIDRLSPRFCTVEGLSNWCEINKNNCYEEFKRIEQIAIYNKPSPPSKLKQTPPFDIKLQAYEKSEYLDCLKELVQK